MSELPSHPLDTNTSRGLPPPPHVADHELIKRIGHGSYGEVWLARTFTGAWRAVKVVYRRTFAENEREFDREFEGIQRYEPISRSHPSLLQMLHVGCDKDRGCFYYVMELADDALSSFEFRAPSSARSADRSTPTAEPEIWTSYMPFFGES